MIAMQTKNKLGKSLGGPDFIGPAGKRLQKVVVVKPNVNCQGITGPLDSDVVWRTSGSFSFVLCVGSREKLGRGRQHQGRSRQDAEGVRESEGLHQGGAAVIRDQSVPSPVLMSRWILHSRQPDVLTSYQQHSV